MIRDIFRKNHKKKYATISIEQSKNDVPEG